MKVSAVLVLEMATAQVEMTTEWQALKVMVAMQVGYMGRLWSC
jgi:hypothetical protein